MISQSREVNEMSTLEELIIKLTSVVRALNERITDLDARVGALEQQLKQTKQPVPQRPPAPHVKSYECWKQVNDLYAGGMSRAGIARLLKIPLYSVRLYIRTSEDDAMRFNNEAKTK